VAESITGAQKAFDKESRLLLDLSVAAYAFWGSDEDLKPYAAHLKGLNHFITHHCFTDFLVRCLERGLTVVSLDKMAQTIDDQFIVVPFSGQTCLKFAELKYDSSVLGRDLGRDILWMAAFAEVHQVPILTNRGAAFDGVCSPDLIIDP